MGKYMRKRTGRAPAAAEVAQVVVGVRTRSRSAAAAAFASAAVEPPAPAPKRPRTKQPAAARGEVEVRGDDGGCYLQLRSRRLFMAVAAAEARCPVPEPEGNAALIPVARSGASLEPVVMVAGISRCSSTASSVDVVAAAAALERSGGAMEVGAREDPDGGSAVSDSEWGRQRREATPSSWLAVDLSDEESSQAAGDPKHQRPTATASLACRARMPAEEEIDEFFAAAEKAEAERFAAK
nr:unnamed protein product [Digitaria exilis]